MDIRVYDFDFNLLCIMSDIISSAWCIKYNGVGTYEGHFRLKERVSDIILREPYLIITEGKNQAVCTGKVAGGELLVCGRTLNWLFKKRVMPPFKTREIFGEGFVSPEEIIRYLLEESFINPKQIGEDGVFIQGTTDEKRIVENFVISEMGSGEKLSRHFWRSSANTLEEIISDLCDISGVGHRLFYNIAQKSWDFEILRGTDKDIVISEKNRNLRDATYTEDIEGLAFGGWYEEISESESKWKYIEKESSRSAMAYWEEVLSGAGISEAEGAVSKKKIDCTFQGTVEKLKYMKDYNLGDRVRILMEFGNFKKELFYKIIGVNIWQDSRGSGEEPIFKEV